MAQHQASSGQRGRVQRSANAFNRCGWPNLLLLALALLLVLPLHSIADSPKVISSTYRKLETSVLRSTFSLGLFNVEVDQPLHKYMSHGTCPDRTTCEDFSKRNASQLCDYTSDAVCAEAKAGTGACPSSRACDVPANNTLKFNETRRVVMKGDDETQFKFYVDLATMGAKTGCQYVSLKAIPTAGDPDLGIQTAKYFTDNGGDWGYRWFNSGWESEVFALCPSTPEFSSGTWMINVYCYESRVFATGEGCIFDLSITLLPYPLAYTPPAVSNPSYACTVPAALNKTHRCIQDGVSFDQDNQPVWDDYIQFFIFVLPPVEPGKAFRHLSIESNLVIYLSDTEKYPIDFGMPEADSALPATYPSITWQNALQGRNRDVLTFTNKEPLTLYLSVLSLSTGSYPVYIRMSTSLDFNYLKPFSAMSPLELAMEFHESSRLHCDDNGEGQVFFHCSRRISYIENEDCFYYWPILPAADPNPFFPRPSSTARLDKWQALSWIQAAQGLAGKADNLRYQAALLLEYRANVGDAVITRLNGSSSNLDNCRMRFLGNIANSKGEVFLPNPVSFTPERRDAPAAVAASSPERLLLVTSAMRNYSTSIELLSGQALSNTQFQLDVLASSRSYEAARLKAESLFTTRKETVTLYTRECLKSSSAGATDPCCNTSIAWKGPPCLPRNVSFTVDSYSAPVENLAATCPTQTDCTESFVRDFSNTQLSEQLQTCAKSAPDESFLVRQTMQPWNECRDLHLGQNQNFPRPCRFDSDCPSGVQCNHLTGSCLINVNSLFDGFLSCLVNKTSKLILIKLLSYHKIDASANTQYLNSAGAAALWRPLFTGNDCIDLTGFLFGFPHRSRYAFRQKCRYCPQPYVAAFDEFATLPPGCLSREAACFTRWSQELADETSCDEAPLECSWKAATDNSTCAAKPSTCLACQGVDSTGNPFDCVEIRPPTPALCTSGVGCRHRNGTWTWEANATACRSKLTCSDGVSSSNSSCGSQGRCMDPRFGEEVTRYFSPQGQCLWTYKPWRASDCPGLASSLNPSAPTKIGCILQDSPNATSCQTLHPDANWISTTVTNKAGCESFGNMCYQPIDSFLTRSLYNDFIHTPLNQTACSSIPGAVWEPAYVWEPATWAGGDPRPTRLVKPKWQRRVGWGQTLDMMLLHDEYLAAIHEVIRFQRKSFTLCTYQSELDALEAISCACGSSASSTCFPNVASKSELTKAITEICAGAAAFVAAPPISLRFQANSLSPQGACANLRVGVAGALDYENAPSETVTSHYLDFSEPTRWQFRNALGARVGQILGDGIHVEANTSTSVTPVLGVVEVCFTIRADISTQNPLYSILDVASVEDVTGRFSPLEVAVRYDVVSGALCASFQPTLGVVYMPIARRADYQSLKPSLFMPAELGLLITVLVAFCLLLIFLLYRLSPLIKIRSLPFGAGVVVPLGLLYALRVIYFALVLAEVKGAIQGGIGTFVLIELPLLLYLNAALYFIINWAFITRAATKLSQQSFGSTVRRILVYFFATTVVVYAIFIAFLVAFGVAVPPATIFCFSRLVDTVAREAVSSTISKAYRLTIGLLSLILGIGFILVGTILFLRLSKSQSEKKTTRRRRIYLITAATSLSLTLMAIFSIVVAFIPSYRDNVASLVVTLVAEAAPGFVILAMLDIASLSKSTKSSSSTTSKKGPNGTGAAGGDSSLFSSTAKVTNNTASNRTSSTE